MHRIGVVGPPESIDRILEVANEFEHEIKFISFPYEESREAKTIVEEHHHEVNGWFFSGPIPYNMAKKVLGPNADYVYSPNTGSSLYRCLLQLFHHHEQALQGISIDMIETEDVHESLNELEIPIRDLYVKLFDEEYNPLELVQFHLQLWKDGKTKGALTSLSSVYHALKKEGVPVFRIFITKMEIRQALKIIIEKVKSSYFKDTQIGVEIIEFTQYEQIAEKVQTRVQLQQLELRIKQTLLHLCEKLDGSFMEIGDGRYQIFSSRGAIEREIEVLQSSVQQLILDAGVPVAVGIGFGETASSAEMNAYKAVQYSKEKANHGISIVQEDGTIIESVGQDEELAYAYRSHDKVLLEKLHQANISIKTYSKIEALIHRMGWEGFTTADLASHLSMTKRNAQRIVASLCEFGLAEIDGEESHSTRGRPSKIYRLKKNATH
ncbi:hypothetical protein [Ammoniphilus sp. 3BR4]|uniref:hypothetical protein n=1 Tax=Ammoniphilus sp. 3BR4 TaxID=3158265 RepID=UPI0034653C8D